ncbi:AbrB/MazE/SpoVT family DNA-binding domain-containing protein [Moorena sp. SIO3I6]|uniref:AbrB/MazE/SpoVT family DNA-binding domain-containing protein n=1 Tax=Moorena sp. SIO3I6 TaxID=2607831 RepID=UPI0013F7FA2A|nr:AbrB/MazE/SpoVT family DNA-binding domain-containing protein [Moorena sp. SIO3I6]NEP27393.1 AbrB/MazE/SpoVT family DNA-binding domain-containing protein [Moorena sp. SIO3I6]
MYKLKINKIGNSLGITLPEEILQQLNVGVRVAWPNGQGDTVFITKTADGVEITTKDPEFETVMAAYQKVSKRYENALRELAK